MARRAKPFETGTALRLIEIDQQTYDWLIKKAERQRTSIRWLAGQELARLAQRAMRRHATQEESALTTTAE